MPSTSMSSANEYSSVKCVKKFVFLLDQRLPDRMSQNFDNLLVVIFIFFLKHRLCGHCEFGYQALRNDCSLVYGLRCQIHLVFCSPLEEASVVDNFCCVVDIPVTNLAQAILIYPLPFCIRAMDVHAILALASGHAEAAEPQPAAEHDAMPDSASGHVDAAEPQPAAELQPREDPVPLNVRRVLGFLRPFRAKSRTTVTRKDGCAARQHSAQVQTFHRQGLARTRDYQMMTPASAAAGQGAQAKKLRWCRRAKVKGKSGFRKWTPEAILRSADSNPMSSARSSVPHGAGSASAGASMCIVAKVIHDAQLASQKELVELARKRPFRFWITNNMMDETKLPFGKPVKTRRCLAWHSQCTWSAKEGEISDIDIHRPPQLLSSYTAAVQWNVVSKADDTSGILPCREALPSAKYYGSIMSSDSHSVNILTSKNTSHLLPERHFHILARCTQHKTGSVCEEIAKRWGLLPPSFCLANLMEQGDFNDDLEASISAVVSKYLHCSDSDPAPQTDEDRRLCAFADEILMVCHVARQSTNDHEAGEHEDAVGEQKRMQEAEEFKRFFPPPWKGVLTHVCRAGCCGDIGLGPCANRAVSIQKAVRLIKTVVCPHLSRPAANRYTKVFPVVARICFMLMFYSVLKIFFFLRRPFIC